MANATVGVPVNFGFAGTTDGISATGLTGKIILQSVDYTREWDDERIRNSAGAFSTIHFYNESKKVSLEYIIKGSTITGARENSTLPEVGTLCYIESCADVTSIAGTTFIIVSGGKISKSNTTGSRVTLPLEYYPGITTVAS